MKVRELIKELENENPEADIVMPSAKFRDECDAIGGILVSQNDDDLATEYQLLNVQNQKRRYNKDKK